VKYWRLQVNRSFGIEESYDLRQNKKLFAGDDTANQICIQTTAVPSKLPIVSFQFKQARVRLTDEILPSLKGKYHLKKNWKTRLYKGQEIIVDGPTSWSIGDAEFKIEQIYEIPLSAYNLDVDPLEKKHFLQSIGTAAGSHLALVLILFLIGFVVHSFHKPQEQLEVEKLSIAQVNQILKLKEPKEKESVKKEKAVVSKKNLKVRHGKRVRIAGRKSLKRNRPSLAAAVASGKGTRKKDLSHMGLLAIQSVSTTTEHSIRIDKPRVSPEAVMANADGASLSSFNQGIRAGVQTQRVAKLDGISGSEYKSGKLAESVKASSGPSIQLVRKEIEVRGGLDPAVIQQIIEERLSEVRYCYETALLKKVNLSGKISTSWTIQADGSVTNLKAHSSNIHEKELSNCVKGRIHQWKFPNPKGGGIVHVKYPFVFSSLGS